VILLLKHVGVQHLVTNNLPDTELLHLLELEAVRQKETVNLIPSENYVSRQILQAQGSLLTNKYAEGYPGNRYYSGCTYVDDAEAQAIANAQRLFKAGHANVQPHSGSQANMGAYFTLLNLGDTVLAMSPTQGGHATHGAPDNFSGKWYRFVHYGVRPDTGLIDYDEIEKLALEHKPKMIIAGASAYPRRIDYKRFRDIADRVGALFMADMAHTAGLVAAGVVPSPVPLADMVSASTHKTLRGPRGGLILCKEQFASKVNSAVFPMMQGGPLMHVIAAKAVAFSEAMQPDFAAYQKKVLENAAVLAQELIEKGFRLMTGGTDTHMILVDLGGLDIDSGTAQATLDRSGIILNGMELSVPGKKQAGSCLRLGTPAITSRGFGKEEMKLIAGFIREVLHSPCDADIEKKVRGQVVGICRRFPAPGLD
jgi:glycine hydroxymethyltransferase